MTEPQLMECFLPTRDHSNRGSCIQTLKALCLLVVEVIETLCVSDSLHLGMTLMATSIFIFAPELSESSVAQIRTSLAQVLTKAVLSLRTRAVCDAKGG